MKCNKASKLMSCLIGFCDKKSKFLLTYLSPLLLLTLRCMIAAVFLKSGLSKIANFDATIFLFEYEYAVPFLSPVFAAYSATFVELACSGLLIAGLATRLAALPLIGLTCVIQFTVIENPEHFYWLALLGTIFIYGAGTLSLDKIVQKLSRKCSKN